MIKKYLNNIIHQLKSSFFIWFSKKLMPYIQSSLIFENPTQAVETPKESQLNARFAPAAQLGQEGIVENFAGPPDCISVGSNSFIRGRLLTYGHGGSIKIGEWCYIGLRTEIWSMDEITIGDRVLISHDVNIHDGTAHSLNSRERHEHFKSILESGHPRDAIPGVKAAPIVIEDDVWISFGVTILKGVRIGKGSVIAAGAIVTKDVPPGVLYSCKIEPQITKLREFEPENMVI